MIFITGATGHFGKATIDFLLEKNFPASHITAFVRDEGKATDIQAKGVTIKVGEYDNYSSMFESFKGADKLLLISGSDIVKRIQQQRDAVKAAKESVVKHIIYTSFERKNESETSPIAMVAKAHIETEKNIKASGMKYTILRNNCYAEMLPVFMGEKVLETGIFLPAGNGKAAFAARADMAEATANILMNSGHDNKEYSISNTVSYSMNDVAAMLSEISGKKISYTSPTQEVYAETLTKAGVPKEYIDMLSAFCEAIKQGEFTVEKSDLEYLLGRKPASLKEFLQNIYSNN